MSIPTTVVGSYPVDGLAPEAAIRRAVRDQLAAGIDILADGQVRGDMVGVYAAALPGLAPDPPRVVGRVRPAPRPFLAADYRLAVAQAGGRPVKGILTGPATLARSLRLDPAAPYSGPTDPGLLADLGLALEAELAALRAAGAAVLQVDEPVFSLGWGLEAGLPLVRRLLRAAEVPVLHVCGDVRAVIGALCTSGAAILDIEGSRPERWPALDVAGLRAAGLRLALGCVDTTTDRVESQAEVDRRVARAAERFGVENLWLSPDCGFRPRARAAARAKMRRLVAAARGLSGGHPSIDEPAPPGG